MNILWNSLQKIVTVLLSKFLSFLPSIVISLLIVLLTFYFYRKRDELNALRAIKSEIIRNRNLSESLLSTYCNDIYDWRTGKKGIPIGDLPFDTSAYEHIKNSGVLIRLTDKTVDLIGIHYEIVKFVNREIMKRYDLQISSPDGDRDKFINLNHPILSSLLFLRDETFSESLIGLDEEVKHVLKKEKADLTPPNLPKERDPARFDNVLEQVDKEMKERYRYLRKLL